MEAIKWVLFRIVVTIIIVVNVISYVFFIPDNLWKQFSSLMGGGGKVPPSIGVKKENKLSLPNPSGNFYLYFVIMIIGNVFSKDRFPKQRTV